MGDFNCCRFASKKVGRSSLSNMSLFDLNAIIFYNILMDLHSVRCNLPGLISVHIIQFILSLIELWLMKLGVTLSLALFALFNALLALITVLLFYTMGRFCTLITDSFSRIT
ncbi:hypothetical protein KFK09_002916 [Dendrobium nobile]|uniref:Uncharacterized protein n=1 Tax=Dendrobium nobile TaxID=94219 RepID=A0A8T3C2P5_DENNO|nr:hypothetical protein KFK09_002916 [Dendrobium nobile]